MTIQNEKTATSNFLSIRREQNPKGRVYKIPDIGNTLKPFDVFGIDEKWKWFAWEFKYIKTNKINYETAYKHLEPHQIVNLHKVNELWCDSKIICYHELTKEFYIYNFKILNDIPKMTQTSEKVRED